MSDDQTIEICRTPPCLFFTIDINKKYKIDDVEVEKNVIRIIDS